VRFSLATVVEHEHQMSDVLIAKAIRYLPRIQRQASSPLASYHPVCHLDDPAVGVELLPVTGINHHVSPGAGHAPQPGKRLNHRVAPGGVHQCAAFVGCYNEPLHTVSYVNAGHTPGLLRDDDKITELPATALPLGLFSHAVPEPLMVALGDGHLILLASKGIVEARRRNDEFGLERTKQYLQELGFQSAHETCVGLLARVQQFMGTAPTHNDVTALSLLRSNSLAGSPASNDLQ